MASVEIRWPSGVTQKLSDMPADQKMDVTEPADKAGSDNKQPQPSVKR
jgi:ASPIC/UnbV protein